MTGILREDEGLNLLAGLIAPSIVLIRVNGRPEATGFFISRDGMACTAWHTIRNILFGPINVEVRWEDKTYPAEIFAQDQLWDLAVLRISDGELSRETVPLPILMTPLEDPRHQSLVLMGYSGLTDPESLTPRARLIPYHASDIDEQFQQPRREIIFSGLEKKDHGISGSPIFDLKLLRVIGWMTFSPSRPLGGGSEVRPLVERFQASEGEHWQEAGRRFDREVTSFLVRRGGLVSSDLPANVLELWLKERLSQTVAEHLRKEIFKPEVYCRRQMEAEITAFFGQRESPLLVIAGMTGSGKTNLLLHMADPKTLDSSDYLPIFVPCRKVETSSLVLGGFQAAGLAAYTLEAATSLLSALPTKSWVLIFDEFDDWRLFSPERFREAVAEVSRLFHIQKAHNAKFIISVSSEFLQAHLRELQFPEEADFGVLRDNLNLFYRSPAKPNHLYLELSCSDEELETLYEHYRSLRGFHPMTSFAQLSQSVRSLISLPLLLHLLTRRYDGREVPAGSVRSSLIEDIILPFLNQRDEASELFRQDASDLLNGLAWLVFESQDPGLGQPYKVIKRNDWSDRTIIEGLLSGSTLLSSKRTEESDIFISFHSEWFYEYFLARYLWDKHYRKGEEISSSDLHRIIDKISASDARSEAQWIRTLIFLAEWSLARPPVRLELIICLLNLESRPELAQSFARSFLDLLRLHSGFCGSVEDGGEVSLNLVKFLEEHAHDLTEASAQRFVEYSEYLEELGEFRAALDLVEAPTQFWSRFDSEPLAARRRLSVAHSKFRLFPKVAIEEAYHDASEANPNTLPPSLTSKRFFILGRCRQIDEQYAAALEAFSQGSEGRSRFALLCRHQHAFIRFLRDSDYTGARAELEEILQSPFLGSADEISESRQLYGTCLMNIGRYSEAEIVLKKVIASRHLARSYKEGTARRAVAEFYLRRCQRAPAMSAIGRALECLKAEEHSLSRSYALEVQAEILALLDGESEQALSTIVKAIDQSRGHRPSLSWYLQTQALFAAFRGDARSMEDSLRSAREVHDLSPYQKSREQFIKLLHDTLMQERPQGALAVEAIRLRDGYESKGWRWYPGIVSLILAALSKNRPQTPEGARAVFGEDIDGGGLIRSHLFARIFHGI